MGKNALPSLRDDMGHRLHETWASSKADDQFVRWATHAGQKYAADLNYAPLPKPLIGRIDYVLSVMDK